MLRAPPAQARTPSTRPSAERVNTKVVTPRKGVENPSAKRGVSGHSNLGASSGIVLYEVAKQRRAYQSRYRLRNKRGERAEPLPTVMPVGE